MARASLRHAPRQISGAGAKRRPVTVIRDGNPPYPDTGLFGINIHRGGYGTTSSLGCQTIYPTQWPAFIAQAQDLARRHHGAAWRTTTFPYALLDGA